MKIETNVVLGPLTTFKIGGKADYFCRVTDEASLIQAIKFAREKSLSIFVLGGGSNLVIRDEGYRGLVIRMEILGKAITDMELSVGVGENWDGIVSFCLDNKLYGLENLSGIPGTAGGAAVQNIGAYGVEVKKFISWVEAVNIETALMKRFRVEECAYDYRHSFFKTPEGRKWIITRVCFVLSNIPEINISYKDLASYFANRATTSAVLPLEVREAVLQIRSNKFPPLDKFGTAGSFFKNPILDVEEALRLTEKYPGLPTYDAGPGRKKVSLAWIIDRVCNMKGGHVGNVEVSNAQALVLLSRGPSSSKEVLELAGKIKNCVRDATGVEIEFEVESI